MPLPAELANREFYKGYTLFVHPEWTEFNNRICFIKQIGLTIHKTLGFTPEQAIQNAKVWINWRLSKDKGE